MPNPSNGTRRAGKRSKIRNLIIPPIPAAPQQSSEARSPLPPPHLSELTNQPWTKENSLKLDWWLWYCQQEFELVEGAS